MNTQENNIFLSKKWKHNFTMLWNEFLSELFITNSVLII